MNSSLRQVGEAAHFTIDARLGYKFNNNHTVHCTIVKQINIVNVISKVNRSTILNVGLALGHEIRVRSVCECTSIQCDSEAENSKREMRS